jgi:hypothetical protein
MQIIDGALRVGCGEDRAVVVLKGPIEPMSDPVDASADKAPNDKIVRNIGANPGSPD